MSLFGAIDDADRRRWQQQKLTALTAVVKLGHTARMTPLFWRLPNVGDLTGAVDSFSGHHPREVFEAWCAALVADRRIEPRGLGFRGDLPPRSERSDEVGRTRLMHGFTFRPTSQHSATGLVIIAEWWEDDLADRLTRRCDQARRS